jgi:hypothetical protein
LSGPEVAQLCPYWWLVKHEPQNFWLDNATNVEFSSPRGKENCTKNKAKEFRLEIHNDVTDRSLAMIIRHISSTVTKQPKDKLEEAVKLVPQKFRQFISIISKEAADQLPDYKPYDYAIELKEGEQPPWGSVYARSQNELEALGDALAKNEKKKKKKKQGYAIASRGFSRFSSTSALPTSRRGQWLSCLFQRAYRPFSDSQRRVSRSNGYGSAAVSPASVNFLYRFWQHFRKTSPPASPLPLHT